MTQTVTRPESEPANGVPRRIGTFASLRIPAFRLLLTGTTLSNAAQWIQQVTLGWLVFDLTGSGAVLGSINVVRSVATLSLAPLAGLAVDRFPRRALMFVTNTWLFVISLALGVAIVTGQVQLWWVFVFTFLGGTAQALDMPLRQTVVFLLVPRELAPNAVALVQTGWAVMRSIGPAVGGVLILWFGPGGNFLVQAGAYALITLTITQLRFPAVPARAAGTAQRLSLTDGIRYIASQPTTRAFVMMGWILHLLIIPNYVALPPIYAKLVFRGGPEVLGLLLSAVGIGGIAGGFVTASLGRTERRGLVQLGALLLMGLCLIGFALSQELWIALPLYAASGFFELIYLTTNRLSYSSRFPTRCAAG